MKPPSSPTRARVHGSAGASPRTRALFRLMLPLVAFSALLGWLTGALWSPPALSPERGGLLILLSTGALALWLLHSRARLEDYLKGARGEQRVAAELAALPGAPDVFHGLPLGGRGAGGAADCDHIVVGARGVFVIETKNWEARITLENGTVLYDGRRPDRPPLDQVRAAAARLHDEIARALGLSVQVRPVLCFVSGALPGGPAGVQGVRICSAADLPMALDTPPEEPLDPGARERIVAHLRAIADAS